MNPVMHNLVGAPPAPTGDVRKCPEMSALPESSQLHPSSLNEKQHAAIRLLVMGKSQVTIARKLGVDTRTVRRWQQDGTFRRELEQLRRRLWGEAADRLRALVHPSLDVLEQQLADPYERGRYRAANAVLRHANLKKCVPLSDPAGDCEDALPDYD